MTGPARRRRTALAVIALALGACAPAADAPPDRRTPAGAVTAVDAARVFTEICWRNAPDFRGAERAMIAAGLTDQRANGVVYDRTGLLSAKVQGRETPGGVALRRCSVVADGIESAALADALQALTGSPPEQAMIGRRPALIWDVRPGGRAGRLMLIDGPALRRLTAIYLDIPIGRIAA